MKRIKRKFFKRQSDLTKAAVSAVIYRQSALSSTKPSTLSQKEVGSVRLKILLNQSAKVDEREREEKENA